jgi:hypothetical protein
MTTRTRYLVVFALLVAGCAKKTNPYYCPGAPDDNCTEDAGTGPHRCTSSAQCVEPTGLCDLQANLCVQCTPAQPSACSGTSPVCGADESCRGCSSHAECPGSNVCLPNGACGLADEVAYVAPEGTDNTVCSMATPCTKVANALATGRRYLKLHGTTDEAVTIKDRNVTVLADPGAVLTRTTNGNLLVIDGTSDVQIYDLAINGASGNGAGVSLPNFGSQSLMLTRVTMSGNNGTGGAITASGATLTIVSSTLSGNTGAAITASGTTLTIRSSTLSVNTGSAITAVGGTVNLYQSTIYGNGGGGISLTATSFDLENNFIAKNGGIFAAYGGVLINQLGGGAHTLEFNTIAQNGGRTGFTTGVSCQLVTQPISFGNNIVYGNSGVQVSEQNCAWTYSDIGPDPAAGTGNLNADPLYVDAEKGNFHVTSGSPVINQADPNATLGVDLDGNARPQGGRRDIGADEYAP